VITAPPVALTVSPTRIVLAAGTTRTIEVANRGAAVATIVATPAAVAIGLRGRPRVARAASLVVVRPRTATVPPGEVATLQVAPSRRTLEPGDHPSLVLVASRPARGGVGVSVRLGVVVLVRGVGAIVHRVVPLGLRRRGRTLELSLRNDGNVSERLAAPALRVRLLPRGGAQAEARELLPHTRGVVVLHTRARNTSGAVVRLLGRTFRLRVERARARVARARAP
jgi:hypothetical protein